jgi:hypothetical protein
VEDGMILFEADGGPTLRLGMQQIDKASLKFEW